MVAMIRQALLSAKPKPLPCIRGWKKIEEIGAWPLPPGSRTGPKSEQALATFINWDNSIQNPGWLNKISLSQLGWVVEFTIHNNLHMRFAEDRPPEGFRADNPEDDGAPLPYDGNFPPDWKYDDPRYNWLADPYSAAVNPTFWKIHGYVDNLIDLWLKNNGKKTISSSCNGAADCYSWKDPWIGEDMENDRGIVNQRPRPGKSAGGYPRPAFPSEDDREFNRHRMQLQRIGVISDNDLAPGGERGGPPRAAGPTNGAAISMLDIARQMICR
jgi:hypothetical protein